MGERTPRSSALTRLGHAVERAAAILFARSDAQARAAGWQVDTTGRWNTSRVYRDPRYDRLRTRAAPDRARPDPPPPRADPDLAWSGREWARSRR
ncbi:MAG TPA: hypothetical protein VNC85_06755 [Mycobacteriales bacterium]|nr:hypothetical protein [Mycobacteriales bacterium]